MALLDRLDQRVNTLAATLDARSGGGDVALPTATRPDWGALLGTGGGGKDWTTLRDQGGGRTAWGALLGGGGRGPTDWAGLFGGGLASPLLSVATRGQPGPLDWLNNLNAIRGGRAAEQAAKEAATPTSNPGGWSAGGQGGGTGGGDFGGTPTSADNRTLDGAAIDRYIATTRANSPLVGMGSFILAEADRQGVSVPQLLGIMLLESGLGTERGTLPGVYNYGGLTGSGWAGQTGNTTGMARAFATFGTKEDGVRALIGNLASAAYRGKTIRQQTGLWYLGDPNATGGATDEQGNATIDQYLATIGGVYRGLGVPYNPDAAPPAAAPRAVSGTTVAQNGYAFPVVGYTQTAPLHQGSNSGGSDLFAPRGTPIVAMRGGRVIDAGTNSLGGNTVTIQDDQGKTYYYAHMDQAPLVQTGQTIATGTPLGVVGDSGNARGTGTHLHLGIGYGIQTGAGPTGGTGVNFDAVALLNQTLGQLYAPGGSNGGNR